MIKPMSEIVSRTLMLSIALAVLLAGEANAGIRFEKMPLVITKYNLLDMGVVDLNGDGALDIFTSNCYCAPGIFLGNGKGGFGPNVLSDWRLDHDPRYRGLEDSVSMPVIDRQGLYIFWYKRQLFLRVEGGAALGPLSGTLTMDSPIAIGSKTDSFEITTSETTLPTGAIQTTAQFSVAAGESGEVALLPRFVEVAAVFHLKSGIPLDRVFVGRGKTNPDSHDFDPTLTDRHGMAWGDYNGDGLIDVFIARGGLKSEMETFPPDYHDELLCNLGGFFENRIQEAGFVKNNTRSLQPTWVDYNGDGRLDLHIANKQTPDQLYQQNVDGTFSDMAPALGLDFGSRGPALWLDVDNDGDMDLLTVVPLDTLLLLVNQAGVFEKHTLASGGGRFESKLSMSDFDLDGDLDVLWSSDRRNVLLINTGGMLREADPASIGLPKKSFSANFVDYNNDGLPDLHSVPGGLYRQRPDHTFRQTGLLGSATPSDTTEARCTWLDVDGNGTRDFLLAYSTDPRSQRFVWSSNLFRCVGVRNHWLHVNLAGDTGNPQAFGARVKIITGGGKQMQQIGCSEGSLNSQGHHRLYFGLGKSETVRRIQVFWPDGTRQTLRDVAADQVLTIRKP